MYLTEISTLRVLYLHTVKYTTCSSVEPFQVYDTHKVQDDYTFVKKKTNTFNKLYTQKNFKRSTAELMWEGTGTHYCTTVVTEGYVQVSAPKDIFLCIRSGMGQSHCDSGAPE